ncbi:MAG TPA: N-acetyltransferase, partial [bacterium]|nr:N-acetyltransferase [bacterium]
PLGIGNNTYISRIAENTDYTQFFMVIHGYHIEHSLDFEELELFFRPVKPSDERKLQEFLYHLSEKSVYQRFFQNMKAFPHELAQNMVAVDYHEKLGIVGILGNPGNIRIIANAQWILNVNDNTAEVAFAVADKYQRRGIGTHLLRFLMRFAREHGIKGFEASVIGGNVAMMNVFKKSGCVLNTKYDSGMYTLSFRFDDKIKE